MVSIVQIMNGVGKVTTSKGVTTMSSKLLPKEIGVLFRELKTEESELVEIAHKVNTKGKSPYCVCDILVKDKQGNILDRLFASIADWTSSSYSIKWRNGSIPAKPGKPPVKNGQTALKETNTKNINNNKPTVEKPGNKPVDKTPNQTEPIPGVPRPTDKPIKRPSKEVEVKKPVQQELPFDETPAGLVPHDTQYIPNIRDFEIDGLLDKDISKRMETITALQKDRRQALFEPLT